MSPIIFSERERCVFIYIHATVSMMFKFHCASKLSLFYFNNIDHQCSAGLWITNITIKNNHGMCSSSI